MENQPTICQCGMDNPTGAQFCRDCGGPLGGVNTVPVETVVPVVVEVEGADVPTTPPIAIGMTKDNLTSGFSEVAHNPVGRIVMGVAALGVLAGGVFLVRHLAADEPDSALVAQSAPARLVAPRPTPEANVNSLAGWGLGDCIFDVTEMGGIITPTRAVVPCEEKHFGEVFAASPRPVDIDSDTFEYWAGNFCRKQFANYVGIEYGSSQYYLDYIFVDDTGQLDTKSLQEMSADEREHWMETNNQNVLCFVKTGAMRSSVFQDGR